MIRNIGVLLVYALMALSCTTEKVNLSPVSDNITNDIYNSDDIGVKTKTIVYQSELSNLTSTFPKFKSKAINNEISELKQTLGKYVKAASKADPKAQKKAYKDFVLSYTKIQKLRKYLNKDQDDVLNRYLVRIKTNVNLLESIN